MPVSKTKPARNTKSTPRKSRLDRVKGVVDFVRSDSWYNALTGLGNALRDKVHSTLFQTNLKLTDELAETLYHDDDMAARIVEALPEDGLRRGYTLSVENDPESKIPGQAFEYEKRLRFRAQLKDAAIWARTLGGAVLYLGIDDGQAEDQPVAEDKIRSISFVQVLTKREISPFEMYDDPLNDMKYGEPETYRLEIQPIASFGGNLSNTFLNSQIIHESRLIRLDGARTSLTRRNRNGGWHDSVLHKVYNILLKFGISWDAAAHLMQDAAQAVFKMDGLIGMIAGGDKDTLGARMETVDMSRSVARAILIDADKEEFTRQEYSFAGLPDMLQVFMLRLAAAARMPVTMLMGQSPAGMNATGESDTRMWYDRVETYQQEEILPAVERFYHLMFMAQDFEGAEPESWEVLFAKLWQMDDLQKAELQKRTAERDAIYLQNQVVLPEEVALSRFKSSGFQLETYIDLDARREMLNAEIDLAKETAGEDPIERAQKMAQATGGQDIEDNVKAHG